MGKLKTNISTIRRNLWKNPQFLKVPLSSCDRTFYIEIQQSDECYITRDGFFWFISLTQSDDSLADSLHLDSMILLIKHCLVNRTEVRWDFPSDIHDPSQPQILLMSIPEIPESIRKTAWRKSSSSRKYEMQ